jgi:hypothetical protein
MRPRRWRERSVLVMATLRSPRDLPCEPSRIAVAALAHVVLGAQAFG